MSNFCTLIKLSTGIAHDERNMPIKGTRDNFKIHVNFMKPTFLCRLRQDEAYDKKLNMSSCATFRDITR